MRLTKAKLRKLDDCALIEMRIVVDGAMIDAVDGAWDADAQEIVVQAGDDIIRWELDEVSADGYLEVTFGDQDAVCTFYTDDAPPAPTTGPRIKRVEVKALGDNTPVQARIFCDDAEEPTESFVGPGTLRRASGEVWIEEAEKFGRWRLATIEKDGTLRAPSVLGDNGTYVLELYPAVPVAAPAAPASEPEIDLGDSDAIRQIGELLAEAMIAGQKFVSAVIDADMDADELKAELEQRYDLPPELTDACAAWAVKAS